MDYLLNKYLDEVYDNKLITDLDDNEDESVVQYFEKFVDNTTKAGLKNGDLWTGYRVYTDTMYSIDNLLQNSCFNAAIEFIQRLKEVDDNGWLNNNVVWYALDDIFNTPLTVHDIIMYNDRLRVDVK